MIYSRGDYKGVRQQGFRLKDPEDLHQNQLQDHQNHPQDHQNHPQDHQHHPKGGPGNPCCGSGGPGGGSGGPGAGSDVVPQGPSANTAFANTAFSRPDNVPPTFFWP